VSEVAELLVLHRALLEGDPAASERFATACGPRLRALLKRRHAAMPRELITDAATDAILAFITHPERYRPEMGSVFNYLLHIADNRLRDEWRKLRRRREISVGGSVELALVEANYQGERERQPITDDPDALPPEVEALLHDILPDPCDRQIWNLICQGHGSTAEFAALLGIAYLPLEEQQAEVKRHRDRIVKRIQRRRQEFRRLLLCE